MPHPVAAVVLAAGKGTRMKSDLPKVLHQIAGQPMINYVISALDPLALDRLVVVTTPDEDAVAETVAPARIAVQQDAMGTGDAVRAALPELEGFEGSVLVAFGADPMFTTSTFRRIVAAREGPNPPDIVVLGFEAEELGRYGRLLQDDNGALERIVEVHDTTPMIDDRVRLCNAGIMAIDSRKLADLLGQLRTDNAKGEFYLTDLVELVNAGGGIVAVVETSQAETVGVDSRAGLARAEGQMQGRLRASAMEAGVTLVAPETVFLSYDTAIGRDTILHPNVTIGPGVVIGERVEVKSFCHLEGTAIADDAVIGPYARLRPGAEIGSGAHIGNFVEVKAASIGAGAKANHLSYIGDASVGAGANIGAGAITCNYDGFAKHRTEIGAGAFIGSNTALVAPVSIGAEAIVGAGSTVTVSVEANALTVARGDTKLVPGGAKRFRARRRLKNKTAKD